MLLLNAPRLRNHLTALVYYQDKLLQYPGFLEYFQVLGLDLQVLLSYPSLDIQGYQLLLVQRRMYKYYKNVFVFATNLQ